MKNINIPTQKRPFHCLCGMQVSNFDYVDHVPKKGKEVEIFFKCPNCGTVTKVDAEETVIRLYSMIDRILQNKADRQKAAVV